MTLLGIVAIAYYVILFALDVVSADMMPQFLVSAVIFISSGRLMRKGSGPVRRKEVDEESTGKKKKETNWVLLTQILNWGMTALILVALGLWVMKPVGVSFIDMLTFNY